jgi:hypothetical protein
VRRGVGEGPKKEVEGGQSEGIVAKEILSKCNGSGTTCEGADSRIGKGTR